MPVIAEDNIVLRIIADTQKAGRNIDSLEDKVDGLEGSTNSANDQFARLAKFAKNAAIVAVIAKATQGMVRLGKAATQAYGEFEKSETSLKVLIGDIGTAKDLLSDLRTFAARSPFGTQGLIRASTTLLGFGRSVNQVKGDIRTLGELAAVSGTSIEQMALVYGQIASLGKLQGNDVMQLINAQIPIYDLLSSSMNKSVAELKVLQSQGKITFAEVEKAMKAATEEGGAFFGAIEEQSKTILGLQSTFQDGIDDLLINLGEKLAPVVRSTYGLLNQLVGNLTSTLENDGADDFFFRVAAGLDATSASLNAFSNVVQSWVRFNGEQLRLFGQFFTRLGLTARAALTQSPADRVLLDVFDAQFQNQKGITESAGKAADAYAKILKGSFGDAYKRALSELRSEAAAGTNIVGEDPSLIKDLVLGTDSKKTQGDLAKGIEILVKSALKAYAITTRELLGRSKAGTENTLQQRKEAQVLSVFLARDLAEMSVQEFRNFHKYASEALGSDNLITLILEGYLKDAEGKDINQDLVDRIGSKLMDSINKWADEQKTGDKNKPGFLQNLLGLNDKEFQDLGYYSDMVLKSAADLTNSLLNEEIRRTDLLLRASQDRLRQLQTTASQGNAEQLQLEEQRQRELLQQREQYLQRQRQLNAIEIAANNAVTVSNIIKGVAEAFGSGNVFGGIVASLAAAGLIAATIASVNAALTSVPAFWQGTEFVTGEGGIDNVPAMLSRGERVVDRSTNSTLNKWGVKNDDLLPLVGSALGKYGPVSLFQGENVSRREFKDLSGKLDRVEKAIYGIRFNVNIDQDGIGVAAGNFNDRMNKRQRLMS